jgi:hypothetical protein
LNIEEHSALARGALPWMLASLKPQCVIAYDETIQYHLCSFPINHKY